MDAIMVCGWKRIDSFLSPVAYHARSCEGITLYRGHFNGTGSEQAVRLSLVGGTGKGT